MKLIKHLSPKARRMVGALLATLALTGCGARSSMLSPHGVGAQEITNLWWIIFGIAAGVFVVVEGFLLFALIRFRHRPDRPLPRQVSGNTKLEIGWTAVPAIVLLAVLVVTFSTMKAVAASAPGALQVNVIGHQWWWEFQYRVNGQLVTTADELHLPVNQSVTLHVMSADVVHDFWVPELDRKVQAIPGHDNVIPIKATKVGTYQGYCAEFCGLEHALMRFTAVVQSQPKFSAWLKGQEAGPVSPTTPQEKAGQAAFKADGCSICHEIGNAPVAGFPYNGLVITGPNLTHVGSRSTIVADQLQNTPANLERWLSAPDKIKPGSYMSVFIHDGQLSQKDVQDITAYLESLK